MDEKRIISEYKKTFDDIHASDDLRCRILAQKPRRHKPDIRPVIGIATSIAAAVMIFTAVGDYSFKNDDSGVISEDVIMQTQDPDTAVQEAEPTESVTNDTVKDEDVSSPPPKATSNSIKNDASKVTAAPEITSRPTVTQSAKTNSRNSYTAKSDTVKSTQSPRSHEDTTAQEEVHAEETIQPEIVLTPAPTEETQIENDALESEAQPVMGMPQSVAVTENEYGVSSGGGSDNVRSASSKEDTVLRGYPAAYSETRQYLEEEWDNNRYFNYIGLNIIEKISLASGFSYVGEDSSYVTIDENGEIYDDERVFDFINADGKHVRVTTSLDTAEAEKYLSDPSLELTDVSGCKAVVTESDNKYKCYMTYNKISLIIEADGITENELGEVLLSLVS